MAITVLDSGTQAATLNTEHTLKSSTGVTGGAHYWFVVQAPSAATLADVAILRVKRECRTADSTETVYEAAVRGGGSALTFMSPILPVPEGVAYIFSLEQISGTGRTWSWSVEYS